LLHTHGLQVIGEGCRHAVPKYTLSLTFLPIKNMYLPLPPCLINSHRPTNCGILADFLTHSNFEHNVQVPIG